MLSGTASDDVGVTSVTWSNNQGGSGTAIGTTNWSVSGIVLQPGVNVITVTAFDAANNQGTDTLTVTFDPTPPVVTITSPTSNPTYQTPFTLISIAGTASDNLAVASVTWSNNRGGSGTAVGTTSWSVSNIVLLSGVNVITVMALDTAGNSSTDVLTVTSADPATSGMSVGV